VSSVQIGSSTHRVSVQWVAYVSSKGLKRPEREVEHLAIFQNLKVGCLHPVACTRSGSGFPSNATLV
jgi:hypothetical protein